MNWNEKSIVFYDGDCGFCNHVVRLVLKFEKKPEIYFCALQSDFANGFFLANHGQVPSLETFYFFTDYQLYSQSNGALALVRKLKFPFPLLQFFRIIPVCQRDQLYRFIAKRRHRISKGYCLVPNDQQKARFLA